MVLVRTLLFGLWQLAATLLLALAGTADALAASVAWWPITIVGANGQQVSYRGPGCAQRTGSPTGTNPGGFIFGWNRSGGAPAIEVAP